MSPKWVCAFVVLGWLTLGPAALEARQDPKAIEVRSLELVGVESIDEGRLRRVLATQPSDRFRLLWFGTRRFFNRAQFEADLRRIVAFYADRGFPNAEVSSFDVRLSERQDAVDLTVVVSEGRPILVEEMRFSGFGVIPDTHLEELRRAVPQRAGEPRDRRFLQVGREQGVDELRDHGYPSAIVDVLEHAGTERNQVIVEYAATPGTTAVFGPVEVRGNRAVSDAVVRRQLTYRPGDLFRVSEIRTSQRRMFRLELFEFANVEPLHQADQPAEVPTRVTVTEGPPRRVTFGVGYGSEERARGDLQWRHVNFLGDARTLGFHGKWSWLERGVRVNFTQPYFFGPANMLGLTAHRWFEDEPAFDRHTYGGQVALTRQVGGRADPLRIGPAPVTMSLSMLQEFVEFAIANEFLLDLTVRDELIALGLDPTTGAGRYTTTAIAFDISRNTTENLLDARSGTHAALHLEQAGHWLPGNHNYWEVTAEFRHYLTLAGRAVLASRVRAGTIAAPEPRPANVPFNKRYILGGSQSLRGWGRLQVGPLSRSGLPIGGHSMFEGSAELRFPVSGGLGGVMFLDGGNAWTDPWTVRPGELRYTAGPGLRYLTPIGPVRLDFGYQLTPIPGLLVEGEPEARRWRLHFSIGQAF
jgi:outer membrane protein assembly complex protein YaeT